MDAPRLTPSMHIAMEDLQLDRLLVFFPGPHPYSLGEKIKAIPLASLAKAAPALFDPQSG
jgi:hypothetical protein